MATADVIAQYRLAAARQGKFTEEGDFERANQAYDELSAAIRSLRGGEGGLAKLSPLLNDVDSSVRCWAATHLLLSGSEEAVVVLEELSKEPGIVGLDAQQVLGSWRDGTLDWP
jgi:hypothetical protein